MDLISKMRKFNYSKRSSEKTRQNSWSKKQFSNSKLSFSPCSYMRHLKEKSVSRRRIPLWCKLSRLRSSLQKHLIIRSQRIPSFICKTAAKGIPQAVHLEVRAVLSEVQPLQWNKKVWFFRKPKNRLTVLNLTTRT